ncbi:MAG TPA: hydantoinase B/oxoprolinase family protein [Polyangiales bacterium]
MRTQIWIDRGGTFTDCIGFEPGTRALKVVKLLSTDDAPLLGIQALLGLGPEAPIPPIDLRMGTTIATNALLTRRGARTALVITRGFADLLRIGDQTRPELFALAIAQPPQLYEAVVETSARLDPDGAALSGVDTNELGAALSALRARGIESLAVVVMHDYRDGVLEREIEALARALGFPHVSCSHEVSPQLGLLARAETTLVDAYLTPLLRRYLDRLAAALPGSRLRMMQSNGGLADAAHFRGRDALLSGPAGGAVALLDLLRQSGEGELIGFDMGGTSTDVSRCAGELPQAYETRVASVRLRAPAVDIHTIAAGGGSLCRYDGTKLSVGPESAGAVPGPLCYGDPAARELALTDVNLFLGRLLPDRFPFALTTERVQAALGAIAARVASGTAAPPTLERVAQGFFDIAVENMAEAIRRVTIARGHDVRTHALAVFGGAGGQVACAVARLLGVQRLLFHPLAGVLSAYGMGVAHDAHHAQRDLGAQHLSPQAVAQAERELARLRDDGAAVMRARGVEPRQLTFSPRVDLRYAGSEAALTVPFAAADALEEAFRALHRTTFGYVREGHPIELLTARLETRAESAVVAAWQVSAPCSAPSQLRETRLYLGGRWHDAVQVHARERLTDAPLHGPAVLLEDTGTIVIEPGFVASVRPDGLLLLEDRAGAAQREVSSARDPVLLEVFNNLFMSTAQQMGVVLQRTALSTNIRERLDFSCAIFDAQGGLVANAPHIPVHLGAMGESVKAVLERHPQLARGDVFVTNDPACGGSHLPDVTVVSPVHDQQGALRFLCASRGHHADIGGITPGSMPDDSRSLAEEGVVFSAERVVSDGVFQREHVRALLCAGPHPARKPDENLADLEAQIAANRQGALLLGALDQRFGKRAVSAYMQHVQDNAAEAIDQLIASLPEGETAFADALDDGSPVVVKIGVRAGRMRVDFTGTAAEHPGNLNAPRAVCVAAVLYVLRCLVGRPIPLNSGCMRAIDLVIPEPSMLAPGPARAVVAGNVETSQRIVDVLLGALGKAAASQGTMNNFTFGTARFGYYETLAGGAGATEDARGAAAVHTHMTNTRITDPEVLERRYPVRLLRFAVRVGSGGAGRQPGGDGLIRELCALSAMTVTFLSERRVRAPFGLAGGEDGARGRNLINGRDVGGRARYQVQAGDVIRIETPGGGGFGPPAAKSGVSWGASAPGPEV